MDLLNTSCQPINSPSQRLSIDQAKEYLSQSKNWALSSSDIKRTFILKDFVTAMLFVNEVAQLAETEQHHPDIKMYRYNRVDIKLSTHKVLGLTVNDFIMAAKINQLVGDHFDWFIEQ